MSLSRCSPQSARGPPNGPSPPQSALLALPKLCVIAAGVRTEDRAAPGQPRNCTRQSAIRIPQSAICQSAIRALLCYWSARGQTMLGCLCVCVGVVGRAFVSWVQLKKVYKSF
eukprot:377090-Alexandrium_andersonii.AAC.1